MLCLARPNTEKCIMNRWNCSRAISRGLTPPSRPAALKKERSFWKEICDATADSGSSIVVLEKKK